LSAGNLMSASGIGTVDLIVSFHNPSLQIIHYIKICTPIQLKSGLKFLNGESRVRGDKLARDVDEYERLTLDRFGILRL